MLFYVLHLYQIEIFGEKPAQPKFLVDLFVEHFAHFAFVPSSPLLELRVCQECQCHCRRPFSSCSNACFRAANNLVFIMFCCQMTALTLPPLRLNKTSSVTLRNSLVSYCRPVVQNLFGAKDPQIDISGRGPAFHKM